MCLRIGFARMLFFYHSFFSQRLQLFTLVCSRFASKKKSTDPILCAFILLCRRRRLLTVRHCSNSCCKEKREENQSVPRVLPVQPFRSFLILHTLNSFPSPATTAAAAVAVVAFILVDLLKRSRAVFLLCSALFPQFWQRIRCLIFLKSPFFLC